MTTFDRLEEEEDFADFIDDRASLLNPELKKGDCRAKVQFGQRPLIPALVNSLRKQRSTLPSYKKMSSSPSGAASAAAEQWNLAPLRTLDDFVLGSARFQLPNLRDLEKWGNRVVKNLLYYQTNYYLMFLALYALMIVLNPVKIACGLIVQALMIAIFLQFFRTKSGSKVNFIASRVAPPAHPQQKWYFLAGGLLIGYLFLYWFDAVLLTLFTLLLPISLTFVHASLRRRNIKNKVVNAVESFNPSTPMAVFLDALNIKAETLLS